MQDVPPTSGSIQKPEQRTPKIAQVKPEKKPKLLINTTIHHRLENSKVRSLDCRVARNIASKEDAIIRTIEVDEDWTELERAWINPIGYLFLRNDGGEIIQVVPTEEQIKEIQSRIIEIGYVCQKFVPEQVLECKKQRTMWDKPLSDIPKSDIVIEPFYLIHVGECFQGKPVQDKRVFLRCQSGITKLTMMIFPN